MKQLSKLEFLTTIFSIVAALISVVVIVKEFINIEPSALGLVVGVVGSIVGAILAYGIGWLSDNKSTAKVFISYSMKDSDFVGKLTKDLARTGFQVFTLNSVVLVGDNIKDKIADSIQNADFFIVVLSKDASESSWVSNELELAIKNNKKVFPILKDKVNIPIELESIQYADFTTNYDSAVSILVKSLRASPRISIK
ncbi:MAG: toll/interleukin-1 receptor domain-containing protein [Anaerolineales bacterium]